MAKSAALGPGFPTAAATLSNNVADVASGKMVTGAEIATVHNAVRKKQCPSTTNAAFGDNILKIGID